MNELQNINSALRQFVSSSMTSMPFQPMTRQQRIQFHALSNQYNLNSKSLGAGNRRYPNITKTKNTKLVSEQMIEGIINQIAGRSRSIKSQREPKLNAAPPQGVNVGGVAKPLDTSNLGNVMLSKMGWNGGGLGKDGQGIPLPISVIVKNNKKGLGFDFVK